MSIVPRGTKRLMVAQSFGQDISPSQDFNDLRFDVPKPIEQATGSEQNLDLTSPSVDHGEKDISDMAELSEIPTGEENPSDIREYIFKKLQSLGYPPRRIEAFESEFITQKFYPGGNKEVTIVLPDRYYGTKKSLSEQDMNTIIEEIGQQFDLSFMEGEREDKKLTLQFVSQVAKKDDEDDEATEDELDEIYGQPKNKKSKKAYTTLELVKQGREQLINALLKGND